MSQRHAIALARSRAVWRGQHQTFEAKAKISAAHRGKPKTAEHRAALSQAKVRRGLFRLTDEQVVEIRCESKAGATRMFLAERYGVDLSLVSQIVLGKARALAGGPIGLPQKGGRRLGSKNKPK